MEGKAPDLPGTTLIEKHLHGSFQEGEWGMVGSSRLLPSIITAAQSRIGEEQGC